MTPKPWENGEGYPDPTAYNALRPIMQEDAALEGKVNFLIKVLKFIIPDFIQHEIPVLLDAKAKKAYDQFERDLLLEVDEDVITAGTAGVLVGKLLQFCNGAVYGNDGKVVPVHDCKLEAFTELLEQLNGEHCLTFYG